MAAYFVRLTLQLCAKLSIFTRLTIASKQLVGKDFAIGVGDLGIGSWAGQIGHSAAAFAMFLQSPGAISRGDGPATGFSLWRNIASMMKI